MTQPLAILQYCGHMLGCGPRLRRLEFLPQDTVAPVTPWGQAKEET